MKRVGLILTAFLIAFSTFFLMHSLRLQETVQLWQKYNIVYVSNVYPEEELIDLLHENGAEGIISRENSLFSVKNHMLPTLAPYNDDGFTSESMRSFFFHDESDNYFLFYVPEKSLEEATHILSTEKIPFGIDASAEYPVLCVILCFAAFIAIMIINRVDFIKALCLIPLVSVSYAVPFYSVSAATCCFLFSFCIIDLYEMRTGAVKVLLRTLSLYVLCITGFCAAALSGLKAFLLCLAGIASSVILLYLRILIRKEKLADSSFKPKMIITAPWIRTDTRYNLKSLLTILVFCITFLLLSLLSGIITTGIKTQDLLLPSPSEYTEHDGFTASAYDELAGNHESQRNPDLTDFLNEKWYAETAAYRKVNAPYKTVTGGEKITLPSFREVDGTIIENDETLFSFDDRYISSASEEFAEREGIEKLLVSQDGFFSTDYASTGKRETAPGIIPAALICVFCYLILAVTYFFRRHKK